MKSQLRQFEEVKAKLENDLARYKRDVEEIGEAKKLSESQLDALKTLDRENQGTIQGLQGSLKSFEAEKKRYEDKIKNQAQVTHLYRFP